MPAGRPRKPTVLKLVTGTERPSRRTPNEPKPRQAAPPAPAGMTLAAHARWRALAPMLARMGVLTVADPIALELLCETYAETRQLRAAVELVGRTYEARTVTGGTMHRARPEVGMLADAERRLKALLGEFGLTPAARSKVKVPDDVPTDPVDEFFGA